MEVNRNDSLGKDCLTPKQTEYAYKKLELRSLINKNTMKEETNPGIELNRIDNNSGDKNPYRKLIVNNASKIENVVSQMEQWSILSNVINYVQYSKNPKDFHTMSRIRFMKKEKKKRKINFHYR